MVCAQYITNNSNNNSIPYKPKRPKIVLYEKSPMNSVHFCPYLHQGCNQRFRVKFFLSTYTPESTASFRVAVMVTYI